VPTRPFSIVATVALASALAGTLERANAADFVLGGVHGKVTGAPVETSTLAAVSSARVYAYEVADLSLQRVLTDDRGEFSFASLPAGLYKIITHKSGFTPMVVLLSRASSAAQQYLEVQLQREGTPGDEQSFWSLRDQVPPDVLREIENDEHVNAVTEDTHSALDGHLRTSVEAMHGIADLSGAAAQRTVGAVGIETRLGAVAVGLSGRFTQMDPSSAPLQSATAPGAAQTQALSMRVAGGQDQFNLTTLTSRQNTLDGDRVLPVEFERYGMTWARPIGDSGHSSFTAQYINESNFYKRGWVTPLAVPDFSQTLRVEGSYVETLSDDASLETGVRYNQRFGQYNYRNRALINDTPDESVDMFGRGTVRVLPAMLVEYGLYTTLRDGSLSLMPSGGVVLQLGSKWQASTSVAQRLRRDNPEEDPATFMPVTFGESGGMEPAESYLYKLELTRTGADGDTFKVGALDRKFDRSLRMYFSNDVIDHLENLFLVPGDRVPEVEASVSHRLSPKLVATLESSYGAGGGGIVVGAQRRPYENQVRYVVTSVNARYEPTSTGVFIAFRRVEQDLSPSGANWIDPDMTSIDSLDLQVTQDLGRLFKLVGGWALRLDVGVDRGASPYVLSSSNDELRKRVLAGVAIQF
jgi:hypothetical protein